MASVYRSPRVAPLVVLGFASGLPLALTSTTLQAWATVAGVSLTQIGFLTLVGAAYTLKFLWAPLIDRYAVPLLGRRRGWIALSQLLLAAAIALMGQFDPAGSLGVIALLAVFVAFMSATQDIAFDAYSTDVLRSNERAAGAAVRVLGYRVAMIVSGGLALIIADQWLGWGGMYALMGALMAVCAVATFMAPEPEVVVKAPASLRDAVVLPLVEFFQRPEAVSFLALIVLYKMGDAFSGALSTTFLIRGAGFGVAEVGSITKVFGLAATVLGALVGGGLMSRLGLYKALLFFGVVQGFSNAGYWLLASMEQPDLLTMAVVVALENLCAGMGTAAVVALMMALCNQRYSATQFALFSALSAVGRTYLAGPLTPPLVEAVGWSSFFLLTVVLALPGLWLLWYKRAAIKALE